MEQVTALDLVKQMLGILPHISAEAGVCCCGDNMDGHAEPMSCGHSPVDMGQHACWEWEKQAEALLASQPHE